MKPSSLLSFLSLLVFFQAALVVELPSLTNLKDRLSSFSKAATDIVVLIDGDTYKAPSKSFRTKTGKLSYLHYNRLAVAPTARGNLDLSFVTSNILFSSSLAWPLGARSPPVV